MGQSLGHLNGFVESTLKGVRGREEALDWVFFIHLQIIMAKRAGGPKPKENKNWDDDE